MAYAGILGVRRYGDTEKTEKERGDGFLRG